MTIQVGFPAAIHLQNTTKEIIDMTFEALKEIIINTVKTEEEKVALDARLVPDVCKDSLDTVELSMALEDNTGVAGAMT